MTDAQRMQRLDDLLTHVWMARTFIKHSEEAEEDEEVHRVQRRLYDYILALGEAWRQQDATAYLRVARKKFARFRETIQLFAEIQPEVSSHTSFEMARRSLLTSLADIGELLEANEEQRS